MEEAFSKDKGYSLFFRGSSIKLFIKGIQKYQLYLQGFKGEGTEKINQTIESLGRLLSWLRENLNNYTSDWDMNNIQLHGETLSLFKSTLLYSLNDAELEREEILKKNPPPEATEGIDNKIESIKELMNTGIMIKVPTEFIMGKITKTKTSNSVKPIILDEELQKTVRKITDNPENNDRAIDDAITTLEDRIRNVAGLTNNDYGQRLIDKALRPQVGILIISDVANEQEGYWKIYDGFLKAFKNPTSHRRVRNISKNEANQIIQFTDYLIGLLQNVSQRKSASLNGS